MLYICAMDIPRIQKKAKLPTHLINFALNSSANVGQFLKLINEMTDWDTKQLEAFYRKYPGLRPD